jgi:hypothetical protein
MDDFDLIIPERYNAEGILHNPITDNKQLTYIERFRSIEVLIWRIFKRA